MLPPDVGCFRANALMASNQAVDSSKVTALPGRGRRPQTCPQGPTRSPPRHVPARRALLALKKFPAQLLQWESTPGLRRMVAAGHLPLVAGKATVAAASGHSMGRGPQGIHGRRWGLGAIMVPRASTALSLQSKELCLCLNTATREHPVPAVHGDA